ncbi:hypothetical protein EDD85DRAFT_941271 [Armillaria nabsnona]|nr:hypothetical protein EDD85DRAFT_941271 [Armillaria nabsnona]
MSAFYRCFRRSRSQGPILNDSTYRSYGAIEAALAARGTGILAKTIIVLLTILFTLICIAIMAAITSAFCGACIVAGHWLLLHLSCPQSPYSHVSFWSTFLVGFWGSMAAFIPFGVLSVSLQACFRRASDRAFRILRFALSILWVGVDCAAGVPLVGHYYGIETLGLENTVVAAYTAWAVGCFVFTVTVFCMLRAV